MDSRLFSYIGFEQFRVLVDISFLFLKVSCSSSVYQGFRVISSQPLFLFAIGHLKDR